MKIIGRDYKVGFGKETTRGTAVVPTAWEPLTDIPSIENKEEYLHEESGYGVIADTVDAVVVKEWNEGEISGHVHDKSFGFLLLAALGQVSSAVKETTAYNHTFSLLNTNQHPSLTIEIKNSNEQLKYALSVLKSLKISGEVGKYVEYAASFIGKKGVTSANSATYVDENEFFSKMITFKHATNLAGLGAASAISIKSFELSIDKDTEPLFVLGNIAPEDVANKQVSIEGNITAYFEDTAIKAIYEGGTAKALRIDILNSGVTIGASSSPELKIDLPRVHFEEYSRAGGLGGFIEQTIKFKGKYSLTDAKFAEIVLTNTQTTY